MCWNLHIKGYIVRFLTLFFILLFSGCAVISQEAFVVANKPNVKSYFVEHQPNDKRGINELIKSRIKQQGFNIVNSRTDADIIVNYIDLWYWDFKNYLLNLRIIFRDSSDSFPIIVGNSVRSSLVRKDPDFMVNEVLTKMFEKQGK